LKRRAFLATAGAALPAVTLAANKWRGFGSAASGSVDVALRSADVRFALLHGTSPAVDVAGAATDRATLLTQCAADIERLCAAASRPDVILLPDHALCGWGHWQAEQLAIIAPAADGAEMALLSAQAKRHNVYLVLGGWWRPANSAAAANATWLIAPSGARVELGDSVVRTDIGNWVRLASAPDEPAQQRLSAAGAEWIVLSSSRPPAAQALAPLVCISQGRAYGPVPPGCPDIASDLGPFRSEVRSRGNELLARSSGGEPQTLIATAPLRALRAARHAEQRRQITD
jgi:hypothetical protein